MSEYQYYEFQAIDKPLNADARAALRKITSRARITATSLINEYHYGDFSGNPAKLVEEYFDAFLYFANWGSRTVALRLPLVGLAMAEVTPFTEGEEGFSVWAAKEHILLQFDAHDDGGGYDDYEEEGGGTLASIIPIRDELLQGDYRALYLGWLHANCFNEDADLLEPPVPPGLKTLSGAQQALADFFEISEDLIAAAAERSADLQEETDPDLGREQLAWVKTLPLEQKDGIVLQLLQGKGKSARMHVQKQFREVQALQRRNSRSGPEESALPGRSIAELCKRAETLEKEREERERLKKQRRLEEEQRKQAKLRQQHLDTLVGKEESLWRNIETLVATKLPKKYDEAVKILVDLRALADRGGTKADFSARIVKLRERHSAKRTFVERLVTHGLG